MHHAPMPDRRRANLTRELSAPVSGSVPAFRRRRVHSERIPRPTTEWRAPSSSSLAPCRQESERRPGGWAHDEPLGAGDAYPPEVPRIVVLRRTDLEVAI